MGFLGLRSLIKGFLTLRSNTWGFGFPGVSYESFWWFLGVQDRGFWSFRAQR